MCVCVRACVCVCVCVLRVTYLEMTPPLWQSKAESETSCLNVITAKQLLTHKGQISIEAGRSPSFVKQWYFTANGFDGCITAGNATWQQPTRDCHRFISTFCFFLEECHPCYYVSV